MSDYADLVKRLRDIAGMWTNEPCSSTHAADAIEALQARAERAEAALAAEREAHERTKAENRRLLARCEADSISASSANAHSNKLRAALARADALVRSVEWGGLYRNSRGEQVPVCPICGHAFRSGGHEKGCELAAYLREREGGAA